jgi:FlaG/FlaF family flagellin (archaellin)
MENAMNSYDNPTPRAVSGVIAVALTALTIGLFAVLPAETGPSARTQGIATAASLPPATRSSTASTELRYIEPIEVVGVRAPKVVTSQELEAPARRGEQG